MSRLDKALLLYILLVITLTIASLMTHPNEVNIKSTEFKALERSNNLSDAQRHALRIQAHRQIKYGAPDASKIA